MTQRGWRAVGTAALFALVGCLACGGPQDETPTGAPEAPTTPGEQGASGDAGPPERGDWLVIHMGADPENLNPYTSNDAGASRVLGWVFQTLLDIDYDTLEQLPLIARELPEISDDQLSYTFRLRDNVTFSDGVPLTAEDVVFSMKVIRHPKVGAPQLRNYFDSVQDVAVVAPGTVRFALREVYFRNQWTLGAFEILPRHYYDPENLLEGISVAQLNAWDDLAPDAQERAGRFAKAFNETFQRNPMGSGAYVLEDPKRDWKTGEQIVLRHREGFWGAGDNKLGDGWVDRVVFRIINDRDAALVGLKANKIDYISGLTPIQATRQTNDPSYQERFGKYTEIRGTYTYIGYNARRKVFEDRRVRRALSHLVDKQNLVDKVMLGLAEPVEGPIFNGRPEYNQDLTPWEFSPAKAKAMLAEAGWVDSDGDGILDKEVDGERVPLRFEIISNSGNEERKKVGLTVIDSFKRYGIDASFRSLDWSILLERMRIFDYDAIVLGWGGSAVIPPDAFQIWHSSQAVEKGSNHVGFVNEEADRILEAYRVEFDAQKRKELYDRFQEIVYEEQPYTFLFAPASVSTWDRRFSGVTWYPGAGTKLNEWWVPGPQRRY